MLSSGGSVASVWSRLGRGSEPSCFKWCGPKIRKWAGGREGVVTCSDHCRGAFEQGTEPLFCFDIADTGNEYYAEQNVDLTAL